MTAYAVIMAGGSGTRFWPLSRAARPKQLTAILGPSTMLAATVARLQPLFPPERILVVTTATLAEATRRELPMLGAEQVLAEPLGRDTAPCVALAALHLAARDPAASLVMLPADHVISPVDGFQRTLRAALAWAARGQLVTVGIRPTHPATGYGYLQLAEPLPDEHGCQAWRVARFVEKPDRARAEQYLASGVYR
ncbi:MAG: sugar phosphate nucleotidyltransferase, partial [Planctomycetota bacterium]|nr:sugar phosphate nucleotidyltransferase [Planctomycetota bacterium]